MYLLRVTDDVEDGERDHDMNVSSSRAGRNGGTSTEPGEEGARVTWSGAMGSGAGPGQGWQCGDRVPLDVGECRTGGDVMLNLLMYFTLQFAW